MSRRRMSRTGIAALLAVLGSASALAAQQGGRVEGKVVAARSLQPLSGAQVVVEGTGLGTLTTQDGRFVILNVPVGSHTVRVEILGYRTGLRAITVAADQPATVNFQLTQTAVSLDELVVTGTAAEVKKKALGTSIATVSAQTIEAAPVTDASQALEANASGVTVMANSGQVGAASTVKIRGVHSVASNSAPIIMVDGVRIYNLPTRAGWDSHQSTSPLQDIDPADIARIEVVKGAAATTLYGTEAAAGVIQIFTKTGQTGGTHWTAQLDAGGTTAPRFGAANDPSNLFVNCNNNAQMYGLDTFNAYGTPGYGDRVYFQDPTCPASGHWNRVGPRGGLSISARGGSQTVSYYLAGNYSDQSGYLPTQRNKDGGVRANFSFAPTDNFTIQLNSAYQKVHTRWTEDGNDANGFLLDVGRGFGTYLKGGKGNDCAGVPATGPGGAAMVCVTNGYLFDSQLYTRKDHYTSGLTLRYTPLPNLQNRLVVGWDYLYVGNESTRPYGSLYTPNGYYWPENTWHKKLSLDYAGTLSNNFMGGNLTSAFSWGGQIFRDDHDWTETDIENFAGPGRPTLTSGANLTYRNEQTYAITNAGFFGQEQVGLKDRLFLTAGLRVDGNSAFGSQLGLQTYPKLSLSYVLSDYDWWPSNWFDTFRLRAAVGESGKAPDPFAKLRTWQPISSGNSQPGFAPQNVGNADVGPERTREIEGGFDASFLGGRIGLNITGYSDKTFDMLVNETLPPSNGFLSGRLANVGSMVNRGLEIESTLGLIRTRTIDWSVRGNMDFQKSKILDLDGDPSTHTRIYSGLKSYFDEGQQAPVYEGYKVMNPNAFADPIIGPDTSVYGPVYPTKHFGIGTTLKIGSRLTVDALLDRQSGQYLPNYTAYQNERRGVWHPCYDVQTKLVDYYKNGNASALNDVTALQRAQCAISHVGMSPNSDFWIEKADFTKLRHVAITYQIPSTLLSFASNASVTLSGENLIMWSPYHGADPEVQDFADQNGTNVTLAGDYGRRDYYQIPSARLFTLSFRVSW